jgi:nucleoside-diphosphate-sugar epimerase
MAGAALEAARALPATIADEDDLDDLLSLPDDRLRAELAGVPGDIIVLGAGGKMGPTLCRMAKRADPARRIIAVARWSEPGLRARLEAWGIECVAAELTDRHALAGLPDAPNVAFMAARKFGSSGNEELTWAMNVVLPAMVAERYAASRIVFFSTGNVLPMVAPGAPMPDESTPPEPLGEYAASCLGRERVFQHAAATRGTPCVGIRLNYAVELRYGVLHDIAAKVFTGTRVPLAMGQVNVIWQRDANAWALRALGDASPECPILNVTGPETLSVRWLAQRFGVLLGREPCLDGTEGPHALLSNAGRAFARFGYPSVPVETLMGWVADWVARGGRTLGKPTKFEVRDGRF